MSAEIASIPSWKQALLERKRRPDNNGQSCPPSGLCRNDGQESISGWSRSILARKQKQKNTIVFMAKQPTDSRHSLPENSVQAGLADTNDHYFGVHSAPLATKGKGRKFSSHDVSDIGELSIDETSMPVIDFEIPSLPLIEERLLPIHTNPILRLDLEKRQHASVHCLCSNGSRSRSMSNGNMAPLSASDSDELTSHQNGFQSVYDASNEEVFGEGENTEDEVTYGKGFVHKLLMKFSHLSSSENASTALSRNCNGSSGEGPHSTSGGPLNDLCLSTLSSVDCSISARSISRVKFHSGDDVPNESQVQITRFDDESECESSRTTHNGDFDTNGDCGMIANSEFISVRKNSLGDGVDEEGLALANIVSNTRSIFEKLVSPVSPKPSVSPRSPKLSGVYISSNCGPPCSAHQLSIPGSVERKQIPNNNKWWPGGQAVVDAQAHNESHISTNVATTFDNFAKQTNNKSTNNIMTQGHQPAQLQCSSSVSVPVVVVRDNSIVGASESSSVKNDSATVIDSVDNHISAVNVDGQTEAVLTIKPDVAAITLTDKGEIDVNQLPLKPSDIRKAAQPMVNGISKRVFYSGNTGMMSDLSVAAGAVKPVVTAEAVVHPVKAETPDVPDDLSKPFISTQHHNAVNEKYIGFEEAALSAKTRQKPVNTANSRRTPSQKSGSSRPGMLLIRPASNLAASKTKSEYLELTKYNDVRQGEFAPAVRRQIPRCDLDDEDWTDGGVTEGLDAAAAKVSFSGAGVNLGRSLLSKTKQGRQLQCNFDDTTTRTFEYPSEQSLMDASPAQPGYIDYDGDAPAKSDTTTKTARTADSVVSSSNVPDCPSGSSGLLTASNIAAAGALSSYRSRIQVDYLFGMHITAESTSKKPASTKPQQTTQTPSSPSETTWSKGASTDLLF